MWFLPTYNRPLLAQQALDASAESGMTSPAVLFVDHPTDAYRSIRLPPNWTVHFAERHYDMGPSMEWLFRLFPHELCYGWLSDDLRPRTLGWDKQLEAAAGRARLVHCHDLWLAHEPGVRERSLCGAFCWGGDLVRAVGWWALPGVRQAGIDNAWLHLVQPVYVNDVVVEHLQYKNDKRPYDSTDEWERDGVPYIKQDFAVYETWARSDDWRRATRAITELGNRA